MTEVTKTLEEQLQEQKIQLESSIRQQEAQLETAKIQYHKVLGALEFVEIQKSGGVKKSTSATKKG